MKRTLTIVLVMVASLLGTVHISAAQQSASADLIIEWNLITVNATKIAKQNSNLASRIEAIEAIAVYDAVNTIKHFGKPYHYYALPSGPASAQAAAAQAAHDVLVNYFPSQKSELDAALSSSLKSAGDGGPIENGQRVGSAAAAAIIALRADDGSEPNISYQGPSSPAFGAYRPTPPAFSAGINQQWGKVKPFLLSADDQFRPAAPAAAASEKFKRAIAEVAEIGSAKSTKRSEDQTHIAQFYKQDAELTVNEALRILARRHNSSIEEEALIFLLTDIAEADARIAIWDAKYTYLYWRPVTALNANADGSVTNNYTSWEPLLATPPHPSYPCGHCGTVTAGFEVLKKFYGDNNILELHTTTAGEPTRTIKSLSQGEQENGQSRLYGGIHYGFDIEAANALGRKVADYVLAHGPKKNN